MIDVIQLKRNEFHIQNCTTQSQKHSELRRNFLTLGFKLRKSFD